MLSDDGSVGLTKLQQRHAKKIPTSAFCALRPHITSVIFYRGKKSNMVVVSITITEKQTTKKSKNRCAQNTKQLIDVFLALVHNTHVEV